MLSQPRSGSPRPNIRPIGTLCLSLALLSPVALATGLPDLGDASASDLSPQMERRIGESIMRDIRQREPTYLDDAEIEFYLNEVGGRLASYAEEVGGAYRFFAIQDNSVNAFAMFGGFIGINTGLLLASQTESELLSVMAHEVSHVSQRHLARQMAKEKQATLASVLSIALAVMAARSNADAIGATIIASEAASVQSQLAYSRDFEREADRAGFELLEKSGFDPHGMVQFFERLQQVSRAYENNAPVYMRSHPLTVERISDMENRAAKIPYRQVSGSLEFHLVRAKLQSQAATPGEAVKTFASQVAERKFANEAAALYGYALALQRNRQFAEAEAELARIPKRVVSAMIERLAAQLKGDQGDWDAASARYEAAIQRFPSAPALRYGYAESLLAAGQAEKARRFLADMTQQYSGDHRLLSILAKAYQALGRLSGQHRALAELYVLNGHLAAAVDQLQLAQRVRGIDFYEQSAIEARLRELKSLLAEETARQRAAR